MNWNIKFKLKRSNTLKEEDETWFDKEHIKSEIITWLEDLDYNIEKIEIKQQKKKKRKKEKKKKR